MKKPGAFLGRRAGVCYSFAELLGETAAALHAVGTRSGAAVIEDEIKEQGLSKGPEKMRCTRGQAPWTPKRHNPRRPLRSPHLPGILLVE